MTFTVKIIFFLGVIIVAGIFVYAIFLPNQDVRAQEVDPELPVEWGGALPLQSLGISLQATLPAYNKTCVDYLQNAQTLTTPLSELGTIESCLNQLKDSLSDVYVLDGTVLINAGNISFVGENGITRLIKSHIQASKNIQADRDAIQGKILISPSTKTISQLKLIAIQL